MSTVKKNFIYNIAYHILIIFLPLITVPIVTRSLGATNLGIYSYTYSISENIKFGNVEVSYDNNYGVISTVPNEGYMVNKVIVKDSSDNIVNTVKKEKRTF